MFRATLYIIVCTARNRMRRRLQRLREPRYAIGAAAGVLYLLVTLLMRERAFSENRQARRRGRAARYQAVLLPFGAAGAAIGGLAIAVAAAVSWLMPFRGSLLDFTPAETALLFPAPVTRRQLVFYRLMRSQLAVFTGALIFALAYPTGSILARLQGLLGTWLILMISHVFFTGVTLSRARLRGGGQPGGRAFVWPGLVVSFAAVGAVAVAIAGEVVTSPILTLADAARRIAVVIREPLPQLLLSPFTAIVRPVFAQTLTEFAQALVVALVIYGAVIGWVIWGDRSFELAPDPLVDSRGQAAGKRQTAYAPRQAVWQLGLRGRVETALIWKGTLQTFRIVDRGVLARVVLILLWMTLAAMLVGRVRGLAEMFGLFAIWGAAFTVFMAPQVLRTDLRQDLQHLETLKTWPVRGAAVVRGEIAWPAAVVTALAWTFGGIGLLLSASVFDGTDPAVRHAVGWALLILAPAIVVGQYTVHNATAILLPAWVPIGRSRPRGVDAMGQRLILLGATWLILTIALLPGIVTTIVLWRLFVDTVGPWVLVIGALVGAAGMAIQVALAAEALGRAFERMDLSSVERPE